MLAECAAENDTLMFKNHQKQLLAMAIALSGCGGAWAVEPQHINVLDGVTFTPELKVSEAYDDNFRAVEERVQSSWITSINPSFTLAAGSRNSAYTLVYAANSDVFHSSQEDNNTDHLLTADAVYNFDVRNRLKLSAGYNKIEETATDDQNFENDKFTTTNFGGVYTYGADSARGQVDISAKHEQLRYQNSGDLNKDKERDTTALASTFYYRVGPRTRTLVEARHTEHDYVSNDRLSSNNIALLGGIEWDATVKTSGSAKFGGELKRFDESSIDDKSASMWEVGVTWSPRTYSSFDLMTRSSIDEGDSGATSIQSQLVELSWNHEWLDRLSSKVHYSINDQDYQDTSREDKISAFGAGMTYSMRRWLDVGVSYKYMENNSNAKNESYERNVYLLSVTASL